MFLDYVFNDENCITRRTTLSKAKLGFRYILLIRYMQTV